MGESAALASARSPGLGAALGCGWAIVFGSGQPVRLAERGYEIDDLGASLAGLVEAGARRAKEFGWPHTYTLTKSLAESLIALRGKNLAVAVVRPSIVETSTHDPFEGWNEGVNTSAPISYLLGTLFRQLPSNGRKCLDIIPVDLVCRGMILIGAALVAGRHKPLYQLATSATNPCNMRRTIELTGLAHRKYYRAQDDLNQRLRAMFDTIPVSKERYRQLSAPQAGLMAALSQGIVGGEMPWPLVVTGMVMGFSLLLVKVRSPMLFAVGFVARPLGGIVSGHIGDRVGRKSVLVWSLMLMGFSTLGTGLLPDYSQIGVWAPVLLIVLRLLQGFALGGEWGGAVLMSVEHAPDGRRGYYGSVVALGLPKQDPPRARTTWKEST